jgi:putative glycosyltransferase (TIGR04348 family)
MLRTAKTLVSVVLLAMKKKVFIVTPALAKANNGNGHTAQRWEHFLTESYHVKTALSWDSDASDVMIALHARRSADSIQAFSTTGKPIVLVLTGTDLYRDIETDKKAQESLRLANSLVTLQEAGLEVIPKQYHYKTRTIYQSAPKYSRISPRKTTFDICLVGHLRQEKDPLTPAKAFVQLQNPNLRLRMIGATLEPAIGDQLSAIQSRDSRVELLGGLSHAKALREIRRAQVLVCSSVMEGGANVVIEAVRSGTPVLASDISGNRGMLGKDYPGYFPLGDASALAGLIERCQSSPAFLDVLMAHCTKREALFLPERERAGVLAAVQDALTPEPA